jgi:hypothetical protein
MDFEQPVSDVYNAYMSDFAIAEVGNMVDPDLIQSDTGRRIKQVIRLTT